MELPEIVQDFLVLLIQAAIPVVVGAVLVVGERITREVLEQIKANVSAADLQRAKVLIQFVVQAAEQAGLKGRIEDTAEAKLAYAVKLAQELLNEWGLSRISVQTIVTLIEAAVRQGLHKRFSETVSVGKLDDGSFITQGVSAAEPL